METAAIVISFLLAILCGWLMHKSHIKHLRKEIETNILQAAELKKLLQIRESNMQKAIDNLFEQRFATIDRLTCAYYEHQGSHDEKHKIYKGVRSLVSGFGNDRKIICELEKFVNTYKDNLIVRFRTAIPDLNESDYILFLYVVSGFSSRAISIFIDEKLEVVYNRKSRLKQRIGRSTAAEKDIFIEYMK